MNLSQPGILEPVPSQTRYLEFGALPDRDPAPAIGELASRALDDHVVVGLGASLVGRLGHTIDGLRPFPSLGGPGCEIPSAQADLWLWIRDGDRGRIVHTGRALTRALRPAFRRDRAVDGFRYDRGLDLSGYEDGTENPEGEDALRAAIVRDAGPGLDGGSFVAVQQWVHDLDHFETLTPAERDNVIGRRLADNEELDDAPASAHIKRTEQEGFDPAAFVLRRSMPWASEAGEGLMFVSFGKSFDAFEAQLRRMTGQDDGILDGLFRFSRPVSGSYFWCPPRRRDGRLDLSALGI